MKKFYSWLLIAALCLSLMTCLTGCGDKEKTDNGGNGKNPGTSDTEPTPEYVYTAEYTEIKGDFEDSISYFLFVNGRFLASANCVISSEIPEGVTPEWDGQYDVWGTKLFWINPDGTTEELTGYQPIEAPEHEDGGSYMNEILTDREGNILTLDNAYYYEYTGPDDVEMYTNEWYERGYYEYQKYYQFYYLRWLDETGAEVKRLELTDLGADEDYFYVNRIAFGEDGLIYIGSDMKIFVLDADGSVVNTIECEDYVDNMFTLSDGRVCLTVWGENGQELREINGAAGTVSEAIPCPCNNLYNITLGFSDKYDFCYTDGSNFMGCNLEAGTTEKILNWLNCDVNSNDVYNVVADGEGHLYSVLNEWDENYENCTVSLLTMKQVPYASLPQKTTLIYAAQYLGYDVQNAILKFNRKSNDCRIELRDYSEYNTEDDYSAGLTKLTTEILSGKVPDIIDLNGMPVEKLIGQGLLADLYPLLDSDPELSRDALFTSVMKALEKDGCLYCTASSFGIETAVGAASVVGDTPGWTLAEFNAALASMPDGCEPFGKYTTRDSILYTMLTMEMDNLVDRANGKCYFDSQIFRDLLEFAAQFPETADYEDWSEEDDETNRVATGRQMLINSWVSEFNDVLMSNAIFGGDCTYIGYPVSEGVGNVLQINGSGMAISAACSNPDAAWQFVRTFFTEDYQKSVWGFPTNRAAFNEKLEEAMTPEYEKDENGNYVLDENGEKIEISLGGMGYGDISIDYRALKQDEADKIVELIESTDRVANYDEEIFNIVTEDTQAFFAGQKSLDDTVKQLQSKLNIYINEQR